jgi:hypothetical protein
MSEAAGGVETPGAARVTRYAGLGGGPDYASAIVVGPGDTGFFVTGGAYAGPSLGGDNYGTVHYSPTGRRLWVRQYDGPDSNIDQAAAIGLGPDGAQVYVTGYSFGGPSTVNDIATVAYDVDRGTQLWVARYDGPAHDTDAGADLAVSPDGETVYVTGASVGLDGSLDVLTIAYDAASGDQAWEARYAGPAADADEGLSIGASPSGVFVTGYRAATSIDFLTLSYDAATGAERWARTIDAQDGEEVGRSLVVAPGGGTVYVTGDRAGGGTGGHLGAVTRPWVVASCQSAGALAVEADYITAAYDATTGQRRWVRNYDGPDHDCDQAYGVAVAPDGSRVFVTGSSISLATDSDAATVAYDAATGKEQWVARYDGPDHLFDTGDSLVVAPGGARVYVTGFSTGVATQQDYLTLFYDSATGAELRAERYDGPGHAFDAPNDIAILASGHALYVTGGSAGAAGDPDYATVIYLLPQSRSLSSPRG